MHRASHWILPGVLTLGVVWLMMSAPTEPAQQEATATAGKTTMPRQPPAERPVVQKAPEAPQNLLVNGSFEHPEVQDWAVFRELPGWQVTRAGLELQNRRTRAAVPSAGVPLHGEQHAELDGFAASAIHQEVRTTPGQQYVLRVSYTPRPGTKDNRIDVLWDDEVVARLDGDGSQSAGPQWETHRYLVRASGDLSRVGFSDESTSDGGGGYLDDIRLTLQRPLEAE